MPRFNKDQVDKCLAWIKKNAVEAGEGKTASCSRMFVELRNCVQNFTEPTFKLEVKRQAEQDAFKGFRSTKRLGWVKDTKLETAMVLTPRTQPEAQVVHRMPEQDSDLEDAWLQYVTCLRRSFKRGDDIRHVMRENLNQINSIFQLI